MLIALEGIDGAGKRTQAALLKERMQRNGLTAEVISFPRYGQTVFARSVADYLNGKFGPLHSVDPHFAALLYAGDRFESRDYLASTIASCDVVILDRYVASNFAYQGARVDHHHRRHFINWIADIEHGVYGLPRADSTVHLDLPVAVASRLVQHKGAREYTNKSADIHEQDATYLSECGRVYQSLAETHFYSTWTTIPCISDEGVLLDAPAIHGAIWRYVSNAMRGASQMAAPPA